MAFESWDYSLSFTAANVDPWEDDDWVDLENTFEIDANGLRPSDFFPASVAHSTVITDTYLVGVTIIGDTAGGNDPIGPALFVEPGTVEDPNPNAGRGYFFWCNGGTGSIRRRDLATGYGSSISSPSTFTIPSPVSGDEFWIEYDPVTGDLTAYHNGIALDTTNDVTYQAEGFVGGIIGSAENNNDRKIGEVGIEGVSSGPSVDTYPGGVESGETGVAYTTTGLASVTSISIGTLAATDISDTTGDGTHSVPDLVDGVEHELYGSKTVTFNGTGPTTTTTLNPPAGNVHVTLSGTLNTTETGGLYNFSPAAVVTDQVVFPDSDITYDAQGNITGEAGSYLCWHIQASTKIARSYTVILGEDITPPSEPPSIDKRFIMEFISANAKASQALGYQQITDLSAAVGLTIPKGTSYILFKPNAQAIRFRDDGTNPTAGVGYPIAAGAEYIYTGSSPSALRFIQTTASATLDVLYYGVA